MRTLALQAGTVLVLVAVVVATPVGVVQFQGQDTADRRSTAVQSATVGDGPGSIGDDDSATTTEMAATGTDRSTDEPEHEASAVTVSYTYRRQPTRPGVVEVTMRLPSAEGIDSARIELFDETTVVDTENVRRDGTAYEWSGEFATVVYRDRANWSYVGNRRDSWTLVEHRSPSIDADVAVDVRETITTAGNGYVGNRTVLLGDHAVYRERAAGETIELVVPGNATLLYGPDRTLDALADASRSLEVGARNEVVFAFATPEIRTQAGFVKEGFEYDGDTILVEADADVGVWMHEYVHTRQAFPDTERLRWLVEGSAEYYGRLLSVQSGYASWTTFRQVVENGATDGSRLIDPESWNGETEYVKGAAVLAAVDLEIRAATDGERTLADAVRRLNEGEGRPDDAFVDAVHTVGGPAPGVTAANLTTRSAFDYSWPADGFEAGYGDAAPRIQTEPVRTTAAGQNYTRSLDTSGVEPLRIGPEETLRLTARITNTGDADGLGLLAPRITTARPDLVRVDDPWIGWLEPNETVTRTARHQFDEAGDHTLDWQRSTQVRVVPARGTATVHGTRVTTTRAADGQRAVEVTIHNGGDGPTFVERPVHLDGRRISTLALVVDGHTTRTVTAPLDGATVGGTVVTVGSARATVGVPAVTDVRTPSPTSGSMRLSSE